MRENLTAITTALSTDEIWLAWCRDNLGALPTVAYEPKIPQGGIPDSMYPFAFLYDARVMGPSSVIVELAVGHIDEQGHETEDVPVRVHGAALSVSREHCVGLLTSLDMFLQAVDCIHRLRLGAVDPQGETGGIKHHPYYEAWGQIVVKWEPSTRKPLGRR